MVSGGSPTALLAQDSPALDQIANEAVSFWERPEVQDWLVERPVRIAIILLVATVLQLVLRRIINKFAQHNMANTKKKVHGRRARSAIALTDSKEKADELQATRRAARVKTLASVGKSTVAIVVWTLATLMILENLGLNISPILASAGVAGIAIGFGAQEVVRDFLSGVFMLVEDQFGVGDTIDVGGDIIGDVEDISLRLTTLRDIDGVVWYVRNGEILRVGNHTDDFSITRLQIPVSLNNDPDRARDVILDAIKRGMQDEPIKDLVLGEPNMQGVSIFETDHISYRISIKTLPGSHWDVERYLHIRILKSLNEAGITTPYPNGIGVQRPAVLDEPDEAQSTGAHAAEDND
ncbi:mechanosensitive ion channel family protein [Corynebacterium otitidis]